MPKQPQVVATRSIDGIRPVPVTKLAPISRFGVWLRKRWYIAFICLLLVGSGIAILVLHGQRSSLNDQTELQVVKADISRHYLLPTNETPALATVTDSAKLTTDFLKQAKNGDEILIYQQNHVAIIYRPNIDRIIAVGPVSIQAPTNSDK